MTLLSEPIGQPAHATPGGSGLLRSAALFAGWMILFHVAFWLTCPVWRDSDPFRDFTTHTVSVLLGALGIVHQVNHYTITLKNATWIVTQECTAINAFILFTSFVLAYRSGFKSKLIGIAAGLPLLVAANLVRLVVLGIVTVNWPGAANYFHDVIWQLIFLVLVVALWFAWIQLVVQREADPHLSR